MTENSTAKNKSDAEKTGSEEMSFADLFEMEENSSVSKVGDVIIGTVVGVVDDHVLVDIGDKIIKGFPEYANRLGEEGLINLEAIVDAFQYLYKQPRTGWSFEVDVRTSQEKW